MSMHAQLFQRADDPLDHAVLPPEARHRSVDQRSSGLETTDGNAWIRGRCPIGRLRTC
jgi:hypothetical protein